MKKEELREKVLSINPKGLYFADYSIDNKGNKIHKSCVLKGEYLTENQIKTCEEIELKNESKPKN